MFRIFGRFLSARTGDAAWMARWEAVIDRQQQLLAAVQARAGNCSGLASFPFMAFSLAPRASFGGGASLTQPASAIAAAAAPP